MNKDKSLVSVVIPAYNEEENINLCLKTILDQSFPYMETIVVDDGSTDKTVEIVKKFPVRILEQKHLGPASARNLGAKIAKGEILVFMDADMTFSENFIKDLVTPIIERKYKGTFSKNELVSNWDNGWARCWNYNRNISMPRMVPEDYPDEGLDFRAILKEEFMKVRGFDNVGYTDTWTLTKKLGYKPHSVNSAIYYHNNPGNLAEVFTQSSWVAKRDYKMGFLGYLTALLRVSLLASIFVGFIKSFKYKTPQFLIFKIIYDLGAFKGVIEKMIGGKVYK